MTMKMIRLSIVTSVLALLCCAAQAQQQGQPQGGSPQNNQPAGAQNPASGGNNGQSSPGSSVADRYGDPAVLPDPDGVANPRGDKRLRMPVFKDPREEAFEEVKAETGTMNREEVDNYSKGLDDFKRFAHTPTPTVHKLVTSHVVINLQPNAPLSMLRTNTDAPSALELVDATGKPWPVVRILAPPKESFFVDFDPKNNPHHVGIQPLKDYAYGVIEIFLQGNSTPVIIRLVSGQLETDIRLDAEIPTRGPNAAAVVRKEMPQQSNSAILSMLNGVAPEQATELKVDGGSDVRAWSFGGKTYLRTTNEMTVRSPGNTGQMSSLDGTAVYELPARTSIVYVAREGEAMELKVSGF